VVVVIFRSKLREPVDPEYSERFARLLELARTVPGFVSFRRYGGEDGERLALIEFESDEAVLEWRRHPEHLEAQGLGRERYYEWYDLTVCQPTRAYSFDRGQRMERLPD